MRFPHNAKIFRGQLDMAPFAGVFFLLLIFLLLESSMVFTPGVPIRLPQSADLPGTANPTLAVAIDGDGIIYYENQAVSEERLKQRLLAALKRSHPQPLTLIIQADQDVKYGVLVRLGLLAHDVGFKDAIMATSPSGAPGPALEKP
jgi:biopolymer transport protein ExbD